MLVRGYAFQQGPVPSTNGLDIIPDLQRVNFCWCKLWHVDLRWLSFAWDLQPHLRCSQQKILALQPNFVCFNSTCIKSESLWIRKDASKLIGRSAGACFSSRYPSSIQGIASDCTMAPMQIGKIVPVTLDNARLYPLTILGASVPQFHLVDTLEAGMLIENTPNVNFSSIFDSLEDVSGPVVIVGNAQLTSLDGR